MKTEVLFFLQWNRTGATWGHFTWSAWTYLSEMNEVSRTQLLNDAEKSGLVFKTEAL